jgi:hypothetical protein
VAASVWVQLEDAHGARSAPSKVVAASQPAVFDIDTVKDAIKLKFRDVLQGVGASELNVFDGEIGEALKPGALVEDLKAGKDQESPLLVKAPPGEPRLCLCPEEQCG